MVSHSVLVLDRLDNRPASGRHKKLKWEREKESAAEDQSSAPPVMSPWLHQKPQSWGMFRHPPRLLLWRGLSLHFEGRGSQAESGLRGAAEQKRAREVILEGLLVTNCWDLISSQMIFMDSSEVHLKCSCESVRAERCTEMVGASAITFSFFFLFFFYNE